MAPKFALRERFGAGGSRDRPQLKHRQSRTLASRARPCQLLGAAMADARVGMLSERQRRRRHLGHIGDGMLGWSSGWAALASGRQLTRRHLEVKSVRALLSTSHASGGRIPCRLAGATHAEPHCRPACNPTRPGPRCGTGAQRMRLSGSSTNPIEGPAKRRQQTARTWASSEGSAASARENVRVG